MKTNIRDFTITLSKTELSLVIADRSTNLFQRKVLSSDKTKGRETFTVKIFTNREDQLLREFGRVLGVPREPLQTRFGMKTDTERAQEEAAKELKRKKAEIKRMARELAKSNGFRLESLFD